MTRIWGLTFCASSRIFSNIQTLTAELNLHGALFAAYIKALDSGGVHYRQGGKHQRGLSDARIAADKHQGARREAAAQDSVQLAVGGAEPPGVFGGHIFQGHHLVYGAAQPPTGTNALRRDFDGMFLQGAPGAAKRALARPLGGGVAAFGAKVHQLFFRLCFRYCYHVH